VLSDFSQPDTHQLSPGYERFWEAHTTPLQFSRQGRLWKY